ncbi:TPA: DUF1367 family protein [Citrobacter koseri]|uniref:DUF1367 family protein n=1 Tax=Citrobacter koseri TaxID=545 RepID=UPI001A2ACA42|nr:DUF1367 family protein [Citrobacter koseri]HDQ2604348.1 DUF1367 family protein [Citrobacter koseri]
MAQIQLIKTSSTTLTPATPEASEFLQRVKTGAWLNCDVKQARNYLFHKRFFALLNLGFEYWTPTGGTITPAEKQYLTGYVRYLISIVANDDILIETEMAYAELTAKWRANGHAVVKSFEAFRKWATIEAGFYDEFVLPDNTRRREARSISFANMSEAEFHEVYKAVFNVLWNVILFRKFASQKEAENVAMQLLEFAA